MVPLPRSTTQLFGISQEINWSISYIAYRLENNGQNQTRNILVRLPDYTKRSCRRIKMLWNALSSPASIVFHFNGGRTRKLPHLGLQRLKTVRNSFWSSAMLLLWCAVFKNQVICPYFRRWYCYWSHLQKNVTVFAVFRVYQLPFRYDFQLVWAVPHYVTSVEQHLDEQLSDRWMARRGPLPRTAQSPDCSHVTFFPVIFGDLSAMKGTPELSWPRDKTISCGFEYYGKYFKTCSRILETDFCL